jgi:Fic family protein
MNPITAMPEPLLAFGDAAPEVRGALARVDGARARYRAALARGAVLPNTLEALRVELTYHSNAIEGSTLTLRDTQLILEGQTPGASKPLREIYEARNHDRALRMIEEWAARRSAVESISESDVLAVHAAVLADIDVHAAGRFRSERVLIKGTRFIPPGSHRFAELVPAMLARAARSDVHPALQAAELHYNLVAIHPFADGNGRTARLLMNYHLIRNGFPHAIIEVERRGEYLAALERANAGEPGPFAAFVLDSATRSIDRLLGSDAGRP